MDTLFSDASFLPITLQACLKFATSVASFLPITLQACLKFATSVASFLEITFFVGQVYTNVSYFFNCGTNMALTTNDGTLGFSVDSNIIRFLL